MEIAEPTSPSKVTIRLVELTLEPKDFEGGLADLKGHC
jgi:hypothetical protein